VAAAALQEDKAKGHPTICLTNYDQVYRNDWAKQPWEVIIVDEGHKLKNADTVLYLAMRQLQCRMRLLLTGTPLQNNVGELWALLHYLLPDIFTHVVDFRSWFIRPFKGIPGLNEYEVSLEPEQEQRIVTQLHTLLSPFLLQRLKSEVLGDSLPPKAEINVRAPLSAWQKVAYQDLERRTIRLLRDGDRLSSDHVNNVLMQLRIVLTGVIYQVLFSKRLNRNQWISIVLIAIGCMIKEATKLSSATGVTANLSAWLLLACQMLCSVLAGVYNEVLLKSDAGARSANIKVTTNLQNAFMYFNSILCNAAFLATKGTLEDSLSPSNWAAISSPTVLCIIAIMSSVGLVTGYFLRHLDSVLKAIASALEVVLTTALSFACFGTPLDIFTVCSAVTVGGGVALYSRPPRSEHTEYAMVPMSPQMLARPLSNDDQTVDSSEADGRRGQ